MAAVKFRMFFDIIDNYGFASQNNMLLYEMSRWRTAQAKLSKRNFFLTATTLVDIYTLVIREPHIRGLDFVIVQNYGAAVGVTYISGFQENIFQ